MARACQFCRRRKIRCDSLKPSCSTCLNSNRTCVYHSGPPKPRPSAALLNTAQREKKALEDVLVRIKSSSLEQRDTLLDSISIIDGELSLSAVPPRSPAPGAGCDTSPARHGYPTPSGSRTRESVEPDDDGEVSSDEETNGPDFLSSAEGGQPEIFISTSALGVTSPTRATTVRQSESTQHLRYQLIANAAMGRHHEHQLRSLTTIRGIPAELALHLLDLHWNRQHHTFLLTYRPAFMRELIDGGPYCSDLLLNAVFGCASKFSERLDVRSDPADPESAGQHFFVRCDELLLRESLLSQSRVPTIIALLMLGSTFIARGQTSKGWLYTGYALRMVYDLGLHLDSDDVGDHNAEEVEIRRRVFWGAFICEKLQSIYLGRPITIGLRDAHVSRDFMDTFEELEPWAPYIDPRAPSVTPAQNHTSQTLTYSVSVFQRLCLLSKIMTKIINKIYFVGATARKTFKEIQPIDETLTRWYRDLPPNLVYEPWTKGPLDPPKTVAPNLTILLTTYHFLVILLHRPFISNSQNSDQKPNHTSANSWKRCSTAARNITSLALSYRSTYPLRKSNYLLSYAVYVACTIHVLNAAARAGSTSSNDSPVLLGASLRCLDELAVPNSGVADTARIIRKLMAAKGIQETPVSLEPELSSPQELDSFWQLPGSSPTFDDFMQMQSLSDFDLPGHDLLFGFMNDSFSPSTLNVNEPQL